MVAPRVWCRGAVLGPAGVEVARFSVSGSSSSGLRVVDRLARLRLVVARSGHSLVVHDICSELGELLELAGLAELDEAEPR